MVPIWGEASLNNSSEKSRSGALGGPDGHTLFLCVAPDFHEAVCKEALQAAIWTTRVGVPAPEPR